MRRPTTRLATRPTTRPELARGARAMLPVLVGLVPAGIAVGAALTASGLPVAPGIVASATVYGASAQLVVIELSARGGPVALVLAAVAIVSVRVALLGVALGRSLRGAPLLARWIAALLLVDPAYLVAEAGFGASTTVRQRQDYYLGAAVTLWVAWQMAHTVGVVLGSAIPPQVALDVALPLCLLALLAPRLRDREARMVALVAGGVAVAGAGAPLGTGLLVAVGAGLAVGSRAGRRTHAVGGPVAACVPSPADGAT